MQKKSDICSKYYPSFHLNFRNTQKNIHVSLAFYLNTVKCEKMDRKHRDRGGATYNNKSPQPNLNQG